MHFWITLLACMLVVQHLQENLSPIPTEDDGKTPDGKIRGLNRKPLYFDATIANPTTITYLSRRSATTEENVCSD